MHDQDGIFSLSLPTTVLLVKQLPQNPHLILLLKANFLPTFPILLPFTLAPHLSFNISCTISNFSGEIIGS